ncbi:exodeoxyribonuclease VII small subunit [Candidatus Jorgensenbacteria bacterium CG11_big_fil_rev_8_21_14_0_20_38_23]|uniref:Exodeoxyribonuclease 7 small subunit n=1 Tax=Candidatus Jorgensenbacteria bacterium CG11_big_fil_rev_8_21_14_0_20_38_23 TaxID=1974594 RepID=A0A2H0NBG3_9BACT|nr:MAG: exodeoxyribonuclease VII small subunit [Candidatus Jorgensenbacteria bacterium CG11_big_fil_rev_8_21_14_0_20_38_23]
MPEEKFNFTKAYQEIEGINEWFQGEEMDLDEALRKYERGMELINKCKDRLKESENKFEEIKKKYLVTE